MHLCDHYFILNLILCSIYLHHRLLLQFGLFVIGLRTRFVKIHSRRGSLFKLVLLLNFVRNWNLLSQLKIIWWLSAQPGINWRLCRIKSRRRCLIRFENALQLSFWWNGICLEGRWLVDLDVIYLAIYLILFLARIASLQIIHCLLALWRLYSFHAHTVCLLERDPLIEILIEMIN